MTEDAIDLALLKAAVDFVQNARGGYGGNVWRTTHLGTTLIAAVEASGYAICEQCESLLSKEETRRKGGSDPFCVDCWVKLHPED